MNIALFFGFTILFIFINTFVATMLHEEYRYSKLIRLIILFPPIAFIILTVDVFKMILYNIIDIIKTEFKTYMK